MFSNNSTTLFLNYLPEMAFKSSLGADELKGRGNNLYKALFAEFFGIFILNFFGCAACAQSGGDKVLISLAFGLAVFMAAMVRQKIIQRHFTFQLLSSLPRVLVQ
jgi:hypothetical protein